MKALFTIIFSSLLLASCCNRGVNKNEDIVPGPLRMKADKFVISKTGSGFFNTSVTPDYDKITPLKNGYLMVYNFSVPDKEGIEGEIRFTIDSLGNVQNDKEIVGIPECKSDQKNCGFNITKNEAKIIAQQGGLDKGIKEWEINFSWNNNQGKYIWEVISTLSESTGGDFKRGAGKTMLIDPKDGSVINVKEWRIN